MSNGVPHINIGTENASLFIHFSKRLIKVLERNKFLHSAIEESLQCASEGYYAAGILAFSQFFNCFGIEAPEARNKVAHEFLQHKPTEENYDSLLETVKYIAEIAYINEVDKYDGSRDQFHDSLLVLWKTYMASIK